MKNSGEIATALVILICIAVITLGAAGKIIIEEARDTGTNVVGSIH